MAIRICFFTDEGEYDGSIEIDPQTGTPFTEYGAVMYITQWSKGAQERGWFAGHYAVVEEVRFIAQANVLSPVES